MKVITGITGHIGRMLARTLAARDGPENLRALVHRNRAFPEALGIETVAGDVRDRASLDRAFAGADVVYHLAALIALERRRARDVRAVNAAGARNVVDAALGCGVRRLIHFSSIHAFDQYPLDEVLDEDRALVPDDYRHPYDASKAAGVRAVRGGVERGLDAVILCPTGVIGPDDAEPSLMGQLFVALGRGALPVTAIGYDWVDVRDVSAAAVAAETRGRSGDAFILAGSRRTIPELARIAGQVAGVPRPPLEAPLPLALAWAPVQARWDRIRGRRPLYSPESLAAATGGNRRICSARARRELGFRTRPVEESVRDLYRWFRDNGYLDRSRRA